MRRIRFRLVLIAVLLGVSGLVAAPWLVRQFWEMRGSNSVRRGVRLTQDLGCFSCHGDLGRQGIVDPGTVENGVPEWSGGVWMMYVKNDEDIRNWINVGSAGMPPAHSEGAQAISEGTGADGGTGHRGIRMPAYGDLLSERELDDLVASFKVVSGMVRPEPGSAERRGLDLARKWNCFSCHGPGGSGGLPNPGSFAGFIPGWYGADFSELVDNREEFDRWVRAGSIPRIEHNPIASHFVRKQRISMPEYASLTDSELEELWSYAQWLGQTDGGHRGDASPW